MIHFADSLIDTQVKKQQGNTQRDMAKCEQQIRDAELELNKKKPQFIKAKEKTAHMLKKLDTAKKSRESARATQKTHEKEIKSLEDSLAKVRRAKYFLFEGLNLCPRQTERICSKSKVSLIDIPYSILMN